MKKIHIAIVLIILGVMGLQAATDPYKKKVVVKESTINWTGKKVLGKHTGTIDLKSGELVIEDNRIIGGNFVVDMTTITVTDLESGKDKEELEGHLNSPEFFDPSTFPEATFVITSAIPGEDGYNVTGELTIKGHTELINIKMNLSEDTVTTNFEVDRTKFNIRYGTSSFFNNLKNNAISDDFELEVILKI